MTTPTSMFGARWTKAVGLLGALSAVGAVGYFGGRGAASLPAASAAEATKPARSEGPARAVTRDELQALTNEMRSQFRELSRAQNAAATAAALAANAPSNPPPAAEDAPDAAPDPAQLQEYDRTKALIQVASRSGAWRVEDSRAFRAGVDTLPAPLRNELITELLHAINTDRLKPDYDGPPF